MASQRSATVDSEPIALVSTPNQLLAVGLDTGTLWLVAEGEPEYYGISWFPGSSELALSHTGVDSRTITTASAIRASQRGWVSVGERSLPALLAAPHQILCAPDGRVVCTNTGRNFITVLAPEAPESVQQARISQHDWDRQGPNQALGDHLNSLFLLDDHLYVMAHGHHHGSRIARFTYPSLKLIDVSDIPLVTGLHNVWITESGATIACHSNAGDLIDVRTGHSLPRIVTFAQRRSLAEDADPRCRRFATLNLTTARAKARSGCHLRQVGGSGRPRPWHPCLREGSPRDRPGQSRRYGTLAGDPHGRGVGRR